MTEEVKIYYSAKHYAYYAKQYKEQAQQILSQTQTTGASLDTQLKETGAAQVSLITSKGTEQIGLVTQEGTTQVGNVTTEGNTQVSNVTEKGTEQIGLVTQEGTTQINLVTQEGTTQVGNVTDEGDTQVGRVTTLADEKIADATEQANIATTQAGIATEKANFATNEADRAEQAASGVYNPANHDLSNLTELGELKLKTLPQSLYVNTTPVANMAGDTTITLEDGKEVYDYNITADSILIFDSSGLSKTGNTITFELRITMPADIYSIAYNNLLYWLNDYPDMSEARTTYLLVFRSDDGGFLWYGSYQGKLIAT